MTGAGVDEGHERPRGLRAASRLGYHLSLARGFLVVGPEGERVGVVDGLRYEQHAEFPDEIVIRTGSFLWKKLQTVPFKAVEAVDRTTRVVRLRANHRALDARKGEPLAWLIGIARHRIADLANDRLLERVADPVDRPGPMSVEDDAVRRITLSQALRSLDDPDRELIALRYGSDLTARQIAALLGTRTNAVEVALHRALARLRAVLADDAAEKSSL